MLAYIVTFLGAALFPLALAAYGGHLATLAIQDPNAKKRALRIVWGLAAAAVLCSGLQQFQSYSSDREHDHRQSELQIKFDTSLQRQEYMRGQLDSIGLMVSKVGERSADPVLGQMAGAILKMVDSSKLAGIQPSSVLPDLHLRILYEGADLHGRTVLSTSDNAKIIQLSSFQIRNNGDRDTAPVSTRLYLSKSATPLQPPTPIYPWQVTQTDEIGFPVVFYSAANSPIIINPTETWNWPAFGAQLSEDLDEISAKLKVFYGFKKPTEVSFIIRRKK